MTLGLPLTCFVVLFSHLSTGELYPTGSCALYIIIVIIIIIIIISRACASGGGGGWGERKSKAGSTLSMEPDVGLDPTTLGS